jgi:multiple sugar transport system substrate-binding protein
MAAALQSGCSGAPSQPPAGTLSGNVSFMVFGDPPELSAYQAVVDAFEVHQPSVAVEVIHIPSQTDYRTRLAQDFAAGSPADILLINVRRYADLAKAGALELLGPRLAASPLIKETDFFAETMEPFKFNGVLTCMPLNVSSPVIYYNKELFDGTGVPYPAAGWTWTDLLEKAQRLTRDTDADGAPDQYGLGVDAALQRVTPFVWQNGGDIVDDPLRPTMLTLDSPAAREALQWFIDLQIAHHVVPPPDEERSQSHEERVLAGGLAMYMDSRRVVPTIREAAAFDWDVAALPQGKARASILHSDGYCIPAASPVRDAAWALVEFASSVEGQTILARSGRSVPSMKSVAQSGAFLDPSVKPVNSQVFLDAIPGIRSVPLVAGWPEIEANVGKQLEGAFHGLISLDEAIIAAQEASNPLFSQ